MKRQVWILTSITVMILILAGSVFSESYKEPTILMRAANTEVFLNLDDIREVGEQSLEATTRSSLKPASEHVYLGVQLKDLVRMAGIELYAEHQVLVKAADGYVVALTGSEVLEENTVYLTYLIDGEPLAPRELGGSGPYQLIIPEDAFSMRWCKYVMEIEVR